MPQDILYVLLWLSCLILIDILILMLPICFSFWIDFLFNLLFLEVLFTSIVSHERSIFNSLIDLIRNLIHKWSEGAWFWEGNFPGRFVSRVWFHLCKCYRVCRTSLQRWDVSRLGYYASELTSSYSNLSDDSLEIKIFQ